MNPLNVFIDTNILYDDPYFRNQNEILIGYVKQGKIRLFLSDVVVQELLQRHKKRVSEHINVIKRTHSQLKKITGISLSLSELTRDNLVNHLEAFYNNLIEEEIIVSVKTDAAIFPKILGLCLRKAAPFFDNKNEFKDSVIWHSYVHYIKNNNIKDSCLLTNNHKDFCDKDKELHPNLKVDMALKVYNSTKSLLTENQNRLDAHPTKQIIRVLESAQSNPRFVWELLNENLKQIEEEIRYCLDSLEASYFVKDDLSKITLIGGLYFVGDVELKSVQEIEYEAIDDLMYITGTLICNIGIELMKHQPENDDEPYCHYSDVNVDVEFELSLDVNENRGIEYVELFKPNPLF